MFDDDMGIMAGCQWGCFVLMMDVMKLQLATFQIKYQFKTVTLKIIEKLVKNKI